MSRFFLTEQHVKLLRAMLDGLEWSDADGVGAPVFDSKRPYGNSMSVERDIAQVIGARVPDVSYDSSTWEEFKDEMLRIHRETETALRVILATGQATPGSYVARGGSNNWKRKED